LTDAQRKLLFHGQQETERMKQEQVEREQQRQQMAQGHPNL